MDGNLHGIINRCNRLYATSVSFYRSSAANYRNCVIRLSDNIKKHEVWIMTNRDAAKTLYFQGWKQKQIAELLSVSEQTVGTWKKEADWENKRSERKLQHESANERIWSLINHNLSVMEKKIADAEKEGKFIQTDKGDVDALYKLFAAVKGQQETWTHYIRITKDFITWLQKKDIRLAKEISVHADEFLNERRKELVS